MGVEDTVPLVSGEEKRPVLEPPAYNAVPPPQQYPPAQYPPQQYPPQQYPPQQYPPQQPYGQYPPQYQQPYAPGYQQSPTGAPTGAPMGAAPYGAPNVLAQDIRFRENPVICTCTFCGHNGPTHVEFVNGMLTWLAAGGICLIGCWLGCCLIPFAVDGCKDVEHHCGSCKRIIGTYRRIN